MQQGYKSTVLVGKMGSCVFSLRHFRTLFYHYILMMIHAIELKATYYDSDNLYM